MKKIINPWKDTEGYYCFGCAPQNQSGLKMEFYEEGEEIISFWQPEAQYQGWFNTLHGGIQAALLDEICGWTVIRKLQTAGVTSKMETRYLKPILTTGGKLTLRASIREQKRNLVIIDASICNTEGEICTQAICTYFAYPAEKAKNEMHFHGCKTEDETDMCCHTKE